jgi:hypothetical protein
MPPAILAAKTMTSGTSILFGILNFQNSKSCSKKPLMETNPPAYHIILLAKNELSYT